MNKENQCMTSFVDGIKTKQPIIKLSMHLSECSKDGVLKWTDDKGFDLMHNCIILNSPEALEYLFSRGYFVEPHQPKVNPYLHLACKLGHRTVINVLLAHRPTDFKPTDLLIYPDGEIGEEKPNSRKVTPLDVAAEEKQTTCVHLLLTQCVVKPNPEYGKSGFVTLATVANSHIAVKHLLHEKPKTAEIEEAIQVAIHKARPRCLDHLLATGVKTDKLFHGVNLYHSLFSFSPSHRLENECYARLPEMTSVLINHKHDVNAKIPTNTFPLYSLIRNSLFLFSWTQYYLECVRLLLKAGANPNFDEVKYEAQLKRKGKKSMSGRVAYSSALHCLMETVEDYSESAESNSSAVKLIVQCADIILQNKANINQVGRIGDNTSAVCGTVLQQYAKTSVHIGLNSHVVKFLLREGADPNFPGKGKYMLNTYTDTLFARLRNVQPHMKQPDYKRDLKEVLEVCDHMNRQAIGQALQIIRKDHGQNPSPNIKDYVELIIKDLTKELKTIRPLNKLVADYIWSLCKRNAKNVHSLQISAKYKTQILPIM